MRLATACLLLLAAAGGPSGEAFQWNPLRRAPIKTPAASRIKDQVVKVEEEDTDDEMLGIVGPELKEVPQKHISGVGDPTFLKRIDELKAYKARHGHLKVNWGQDKSLAQFCVDVRRARKGTGQMKLDDGRIASLDALGFDWEPQNRKEEQFQERLEELKAYKAEHGHLNVKKSEDKSLHHFCTNIRSARRGRGDMKLTDERIASLVALGFDWGQQSNKVKSFQERIEELKAYKARHGHLKVKEGEDKSLHHFCKNIRRARRGRGTYKLTDKRIASLDALGFDWKPRSNKVRSFEERLQDLKAYKFVYKHVNVKKSEDKSLHWFCKNVRRASGKKRLTEGQIASLDALGFDWKPRVGKPRTYFRRGSSS